MKKRFNKIIITAIMLFLVLFTVTILAVFWHTGNEPTVLVGAVFAAATGEFWSLAKIRMSENQTPGEQETWDEPNRIGFETNYNEYEYENEEE